VTSSLDVNLDSKVAEQIGREEDGSRVSSGYRSGIDLRRSVLVSVQVPFSHGSLWTVKPLVQGDATITVTDTNHSRTLYSYRSTILCKIDKNSVFDPNE
jgi:hypothetical protein